MKLCRRTVPFRLQWSASGWYNLNAFVYLTKHWQSHITIYFMFSENCKNTFFCNLTCNLLERREEMSYLIFLLIHWTERNETFANSLSIPLVLWKPYSEAVYCLSSVCLFKTNIIFAMFALFLSTVNTKLSSLKNEYLCYLMLLLFKIIFFL